MGVTRKERLLKAMLEDNAAACGGGVTREERLLAQTAKKACENDVLEGGGGSGGGVVWVDPGSLTTDIVHVIEGDSRRPMTFAEFKAAFANGPIHYGWGGDDMPYVGSVIGYMINDGTVMVNANNGSTPTIQAYKWNFAEE